MVKWIVGAVVLAGVALGAWVSWAGGGVSVETAVAERGRVRAYVEEIAETRLPRTFAVGMPVDGRVRAIELEAGDRVSAGDIVARLDRTALASRVEAERARIARLEAEIARATDERLERTLIEQIEALIESIDQTVLAAEAQTEAARERKSVATAEREELEASLEVGAATELELRRARLSEVEAEVSLRESFLTLRAAEAVRTAAAIGPRFVNQMIDMKALDVDVLARQVEEARANLAALEDDLRRADIVAPVDGVVLARLVDSERVLAAGEMLVEIGRLGDLEVEIEMLTDEAGRVRVGDPVEIRWPALEAPVAGRVSRIEPRAFTKVSSLGVEQQRVLVIVAPEAEALADVAGGLGAAYRVRTRVFTDEGEGVVVPRGAVFRGADGDWRAFVVRGGRARLVGVTVGVMNAERVVVGDGVGSGDVVVVAPPVDLANGARVREAG